MTRRTALTALALAAGVAASILTAPQARANRQSAPPSAAAIAARDGCERTTTQVRLTETDATTYRVAGWLCGPRRPRNHEVQFLVHGFTYDHLYWMGLGFRRLDYVRAAAARGHTTFVVDRLGAGASDHPNPDAVTFPNEAYVLHQLVSGLRAGAIGHDRTPFRRVVGVGHSMGAGMWNIEAGTYHDVDALILADFLHAADPDFVTYLRAHYIAASTLPAFASLPDGYLTVEPRSIFYDTTRTRPSVIERDEAIGIDTGTRGEAATLAMGRDLTYSQAVTAPVLMVTGRQDALGCNEAKPGLSCATASAVADRERPAYTSAACLDAFVLDSGHDTNLHNAAPEWFARANTWADAVRTGRTCATG